MNRFSITLPNGQHLNGILMAWLSCYPPPLRCGYDAHPPLTFQKSYISGLSSQVSAAN